jgi:hypothetical protein
VACIQQNSTGRRYSFGAKESRRRANERHPCRDENVALGVNSVRVDRRVGEQAVECLSGQEEKQHQPGRRHWRTPIAKSVSFSTQAFSKGYDVEVAL